ncbi:MAG: ATP-binding cassette domain-containing protein [Pseudomonadota bacterium]
MNNLTVKSLNISLPDGTRLCNDLSFSIEPGRVLALMGPSGSGKSTILSWITGTIDSRIKATGEVYLGDTRLTDLPAEKRRLGLMLQQDYLFPHMSVGQNLKFGLRSGSRATREKRIEESLREASLEGMANRDPGTLSGGQRARVSLLRTLLSDPSALLLDEPFSRLDVNLREQIRTFTWSQSRHLPTLLVTHDLADIPAHASKIELDPDDNHHEPLINATLNPEQT